MKREELKELGVSDELIGKIMKINGEDIEHAKESLNTDLKEARKQLKDANEKLKDAEKNGNDITELRKQLEDFQTKETERKKAEEREKRDRELDERIQAVIPDGTEFVNDMTRAGVMDAVKKAMAENDTFTAKEAWENVTKDKPEFFKNPQHDQLKLPNVNGNKGTPLTKEAIDSMTPDEINQNWESVSKFLAGGK